MRKSSTLSSVQNIINENQDWKKYLNEQDINIMDLFLKSGSIKFVANSLNWNYIKTRDHLIDSVEKIKNKKMSTYNHADELLKLAMKDNTWETLLTPTEVKVLKSFIKTRKVVPTAKEVGMLQCNVSIYLFGTKERTGILNKLKKFYMNY